VKEPGWAPAERHASRWVVLLVVGAMLGAVNVALWHGDTRPLRPLSAVFNTPTQPASLEQVRSIGTHRCHDLHMPPP
jgi:hypothetical protein